MTAVTIHINLSCFLKILIYFFRDAIWHGGSKFKFYIKKGGEKPMNVAAVAGKQQFNTASTILPLPVIQ